MELTEIWKELDQKKLSKPVSGAIDIVKTSKHPIEKLRKAYRLSVGFTLLSLTMFIILFFVNDDWLIKGSVLLVIVGYIIFLLTNVSMYRKISTSFPVDKSLIVALEHTHDFITKNIRFQERVGLYVYPFAVTCGFLLGGSTGGDLQTFITKPIVAIVLFVLVVVLTPLCFYLTRWMYAISYEKCLAELKGLIDELRKSG